MESLLSMITIEAIESNHHMQASSDVAQQNGFSSTVSDMFPQSPEQIKSFKPDD